MESEPYFIPYLFHVQKKGFKIIRKSLESEFTLIYAGSDRVVTELTCSRVMVKPWQNQFYMSLLAL